MKTIEVSPSEMEKHIARFGKLRPQAEMYDEKSLIPREAYEMFAAKTLYLLMAPETQGGPMAQGPAVAGDKGLSVIIASCPPGDKPMLHAHMKTQETFMCLTGRFRIRWGDDAEHETHINPFDLIAVPRGVCRDFTNVTDQDALLLVLITGGSDEDYNDIVVAPGESKILHDRFGKDVIKAFEGRGITFQGLDA